MISLKDNMKSRFDNSKQSFLQNSISEGDRKTMNLTNRFISFSLMANGFYERMALNQEKHLLKLSLHHKPLVRSFYHGNECKILIT